MADHVKNRRPQPDGDDDTAELAKFFINPQFGHFDEPSTVLDKHGRIMVWHLPKIYSPFRTVCIFLALSWLW